MAMMARPPQAAAADRRLLGRTYEIASAFLDGLPDRHVNAHATARQLRAHLEDDLSIEGVDPLHVIEELASQADPGLVAGAGPRYFGFVTGGALPVALAADWLVAAWDQNPSLYVLSPAAAIIEDIAAAWLLDLLGLPRSASVGFVTGCHTANITAIAAARHAVLRRAGWDVEADGLTGAPRVRVIVGDEVHVSVLGALRLLGFGTAAVIRVPADAQGRLQPDTLASILRACDGPTIVCAQAGNVNTGACDPLQAIAPLVHEHGAWLHVDGAFGLWASAVPSLRALVAGVELADSWATDAHKWLNVPYDSGIVCVAHPAAHRAAMSLTASYLERGAAEDRNGMDWVPEASRRARAIPIYAALRTLGRTGVAALVDRCCRLARRMADCLATDGATRILNDVVLNQVLVRFEPRQSIDDMAAGRLERPVPVAQSLATGDRLTRAVIAAVQREGTCWLGGTTWRGMAAMRISVSNWSTSDEDIDRSAGAILRAAEEERGRGTRAEA